MNVEAICAIGLCGALYLSIPKAINVAGRSLRSAFGMLSTLVIEYLNNFRMIRGYNWGYLVLLFLTYPM